jgi:hypothetical protein
MLMIDMPAPPARRRVPASGHAAIAGLPPLATRQALHALCVRIPVKVLTATTLPDELAAVYQTVWVTAKRPPGQCRYHCQHSERTGACIWRMLTCKQRQRSFYTSCIHHTASGCQEQAPTTHNPGRQHGAGCWAHCAGGDLAGLSGQHGVCRRLRSWCSTPLAPIFAGDALLACDASAHC